MKKLIPGLMLIASTCAHSGTLSCDVTKYTAYEFLTDYVSNYTTFANEVLLAHHWMDAGSTYGQTVSFRITNSSPINISAKLWVSACYNSAAYSPQGCFASTGQNPNQMNTNKSNVLIPANGSVLGSMYFGSSNQKMALKLYLSPGSTYVQDTITTNATGKLSGSVWWDNIGESAARTASYNAHISPKLDKQYGVQVRDNVSPTNSLHSGINWLTQIWPTDNSPGASIPVKLKYLSGDGDGFAVVVGGGAEGTTHLSVGGETSAQKGERIGLTVEDGASPGNKQANLEASWTCP